MGATVMLFGCCCAPAFDVSSFAVIDGCEKEPSLAGIEKTKGEVGGREGRLGWGMGRRGKGQKRRGIGLLGSCWEPAVDRCKER